MVFGRLWTQIGPQVFSLIRPDCLDVVRPPEGLALELFPKLEASVTIAAKTEAITSLNIISGLTK